MKNHCIHTTNLASNDIGRFMYYVHIKYGKNVSKTSILRRGTGNKESFWINTNKIKGNYVIITGKED